MVEETSRAIEGAEGIQRKGLVLATLTRLKQVCNHPAHFLGDHSPLPDDLFGEVRQPPLSGA